MIKFWAPSPLGRVILMADLVTKFSAVAGEAQQEASRASNQTHQLTGGVAVPLVISTL